MIDIFMYCSYNLAASGYQMSKVDYANEKMILINRENLNLIPKMVKTIFTHGGAKVVLGKYQSDKMYFVIKGIVNENQEKNKDEQGRKVFVNIAFVYDNADIAYMKKIVQYVLVNFLDFSREICNLIIVKNDALGYEVNYAGLKGFLNNLKQGSILYDESAAVNRYVSTIKKIDISANDNFSFVVLESSWKYFFDMCDINLSYERQKNSITVEEFENSIAKCNGLVKLLDSNAHQDKIVKPAVSNPIAITDKKIIEKAINDESDTIAATDSELVKPLPINEIIINTNKRSTSYVLPNNQAADSGILNKYLLYILAGIGSITIVVLLIKLIIGIFSKGGN